MILYDVNVEVLAIYCNINFVVLCCVVVLFGTSDVLLYLFYLTFVCTEEYCITLISCWVTKKAQNIFTNNSRIFEWRLVVHILLPRTNNPTCVCVCVYNSY